MQRGASAPPGWQKGRVVCYVDAYYFSPPSICTTRVKARRQDGKGGIYGRFRGANTRVHPLCVYVQITA